MASLGTYRGTWSNATQYFVDDVVHYKGGCYVALQNNLAASPSSWNHLTWGTLCQPTDLSSPGGRLSLVSGDPIPDSDVTGNLLYYVPYKHNCIKLWNGSFLENVRIAGHSVDLSALPANTTYDIFGYKDDVYVKLEALAWASASARATSIVFGYFENDVDVPTPNIDLDIYGGWHKNGDKTRMYLGSVRKASTEVQDNKRFRWVYNQFNRVPRELYAADATASWTYNSATWRAMRGVSANSVSVLVPMEELLIDLELVTNVDTTTDAALVGIGVDSTVTTSGIRGRAGTSQNGASASAKLKHAPSAVGVPFFYALEACEVGGVNATFRGAPYGGLTGVVTM